MNFKDNNITTPEQLMEFLQKNMKYGFTCQNKIYTENEPDFQKNMDKFYKLRVGDDFVESGYGVCWDFCEFEREFFKQMNIPHECYFFLSFVSRNEGGPTHTFLIYEQDKKWFWFEYSWLAYRGIWKYDSKHEALTDILKKFCMFNDRPYDRVEIYKTSRAKEGLNTFEFVEHCLNGEKIELKNVKSREKK